MDKGVKQSASCQSQQKEQDTYKGPYPAQRPLQPKHLFLRGHRLFPAAFLRGSRGGIPVGQVNSSAGFYGVGFHILLTKIAKHMMIHGIPTATQAIHTLHPFLFIFIVLYTAFFFS